MVYVLLADGFEEIEALAFVDILRRAEIDVMITSIYENKIVKGSHGITVTADIVITDIDKDDIEAIVLPGGMPGTLNLQKSIQVTELIEWADNNNKYLGAICAAPMVFGEMGILNGRKATCFPGFEKHLIGSTLKNEKVVKDENVITAKGAGAASDFAHCFVMTLKDKETADRIIKSMQY